MTDLATNAISFFERVLDRLALKTRNRLVF